MKFALNEDQQALQEAVRSFLGGSDTLAALRDRADGKSDAADALEHGLRDLGLPGLCVPESAGGLGLGLMEAALVQEALGYHASPAGGVQSGAGAAFALSRASGTDTAVDLSDMASGETRFALALSEHTGARSGTGIVADGGTLAGRSMFVLGGEQATHVLIADMTRRLHVIDARANDVSWTRLATIDASRTLFELDMKAVPAQALDEGNSPGQALEKAIMAQRILLAADTLGAAQAMLDMAVDYAGTREQFGRKIGSFQAVKHMCAEMAAKLEPARALIWQAAHAFDAIPEDAPLLSRLAKAHMAEVGTFIARTSTEVHGGMGFTDLLGLHYWFKRIGLNRQLLGGPERLRAEAAALQGWGKAS